MAYKGTPLVPSGLITRVRQTFLVGAAAGNYTLTGIIKDHDKILQVTLVKLALAEGTPNTITWTASDLTSQFSITANDTINNTGGAAGTGGFLVVLWYDSDFGIGRRAFP